MNSKVPWKHLYSQFCPPIYAKSDDVPVVYRLVKGIIPELSDFEPLKLKNPGDKRARLYPCKASATSVFTDICYLQNTIQKLPPHKHQKVAKGSIAKSDGKIKRGGNSHISWWVYIKDPHNKFKVIP